MRAVKWDTKWDLARCVRCVSDCACLREGTFANGLVWIWQARVANPRARATLQVQSCIFLNVCAAAERPGVGKAERNLSLSLGCTGLEWSGLALRFEGGGGGRPAHPRRLTQRPPMLGCEHEGSCL